MRHNMEKMIVTVELIRYSLFENDFESYFIDEWLKKSSENTNENSSFVFIIPLSQLFIKQFFFSFSIRFRLVTDRNLDFFQMIFYEI